MASGYTDPPLPIQAGVTYDFSFWAISNAPNLTLQFTFADLTPAGAYVARFAKFIGLA